MNEEQYTIDAIGVLHTPFKEKFAIPRQPRLVPQAKGRLVLQGEFANDDLLRDIEQFSHLWLLFMFHQNLDNCLLFLFCNNKLLLHYFD